MRLSFKAIVLAIAVVSLNGCFYSFNPRGESTIKSIAIETFESRTAELALSERVTVLLTDAFIADGTIKIVPANLADAVLSGALTSYNRVADVFDQNDQVSRYKVTMGFELILKNSKDGTQLWKENTLQEGTYDAISETEEDGQSRATARLVEVVLNKTTKSW